MGQRVGDRHDPAPLPRHRLSPRRVQAKRGGRLRLCRCEPAAGYAGNKDATGCFIPLYPRDAGFVRGAQLVAGKRAEGWAQRHQICPLLVSAQPNWRGQEDQLLPVAHTGLSASDDALTHGEQYLEWVLLCDLSSDSRLGVGGTQTTGGGRAACFWFSTLIFISHHESCYVLS